MANRKIDIVLWGCTGFTGGLVAEYFASSVSPNIKWALAGRTLEKLESLRNKLCKINESCSNLPLIQANITDEESLTNMTKQTKVLLSTAGPFILCGTPIVKACVENGTNYCDITGEVPWIGQLISKYHDEAEKNGTHIVPACGFDSIPFDMGAFLVAEEAKKYGGVNWIKGFAQVKGKPSGGTLHTMLNLLETIPMSKMGNPHIIDPPKYKHEKIQPGAKDQSLPKYDNILKTWTAPFVMSGVNTRIVRRSSLLYKDAGESYGPDNFYYAETEIKKSFLSAFFHVFGLGLFLIFAFFSFGRSIIKKVIPQPGTGPSKKERDNSWFKIKFVGDTVNGNKLLGTVSGGDPGYSETAKMVSNAAICLVDSENLPGKGGVITPANSMGMNLVKRLQDANITLKVEELSQ